MKLAACRQSPHIECESTGYGELIAVPHFSTFGKNYMRRFQDTDLFEQIFQRILKACMEAGLWMKASYS